MRACLFLRCLVFGATLAPCIANGQDEITPATYTNSGISCNVPLNEINIRAYRNFHQRYPSDNKTSEYWFKSAEGYQVSFVQDALRHQAYFDQRGTFLYSLKYYAGARLMEPAKDLVRKKYPDYQIEVVTEITDGEKIFYLVKIVNPLSVKTLSVCDGKVDLMDEVVNGGPQDISRSGAH